jgi:DNA mismatch repair protein MutS
MYSPMIQQYLELKNTCKDCLLFFRVGDFYELFFEDAIKVSQKLELTLTGKDCGLRDRAPMCGVPYNSVNIYISKLINHGYKVAIAEQTDDLQDGNKNLMERKITKIITRGTVTDTEILEETKNNYILCAYKRKSDCGLSVVDITTGEFYTFAIENITERKLIDEIAKFKPVEIITNGGFDLSAKIFEVFDIKTEEFYEWSFDYLTAYNRICNYFGVLNLYCFGFADDEYDKLCISASGALLEYLYQVRKGLQVPISHLEKRLMNNFMSIDIASRKNLELTENNRDRTKKMCLLSVLDKTKTAMGARLMVKTIENPLIDVTKITRRHNAVEELLKNPVAREELRSVLKKIRDIERIAGKISMNIATVKDLLCLFKSISNFGDIKNILSRFESELLMHICQNFDLLSNIYSLLNDSLETSNETVSNDSGFVKIGYDTELDQLRSIRDNSEKTIRDFESAQKIETGIKNLKIKQNKIFGYYIEITNSYKGIVPDSYILKQTLANCAKYFTSDLKKIESEIYSADKKINLLEHEIFTSIIKEILKEIPRIQKVASLIAHLDILLSFAEVAEENNYIKPIVNLNGIIKIKNGRHPVVEKFVSSGFIANDTYLDLENNKIYLITGPNMVGKSTYMRQVALIILMAQIGCFVPAEQAVIGVVDKIFTRIGASDNLATGQSTFMIEMSEVANILYNATKNSFVIIDEVGRGTSTCDGLSIAWAVIEYVAHEIGCRTLFATHYHELTALEGKIAGLKNYCAAVKKENDEIIFLRKIIPGVINHSYGICVAKLAGLPEKVLARADEVLCLLDGKSLIKNNDAFEHAFGVQEVFYKSDNAEDNISEDDSATGNNLKSNDIYSKNRYFFNELRPVDKKKISVKQLINVINELRIEFDKASG